MPVASHIALEIPDLLDWSAGGVVNPRFAPPEELPGLGAVARLHLMDLLIDEDTNMKRRQRMLTARAHLATRSWRPLGDDVAHPTDPGRLRDQFHGRLPEAMCLSLLVEATIDGPFAPFQISIPPETLEAALRQFASDLGAPRMWADAALAAVKDTEPPRIAVGTGEIDEKLRRLHAVAVAKMRLRPATPVTEIEYLRQLRSGLENDLTVHSLVDDPRTAPTREIKGRIKAVSGILKQLEKETRR